MAGHAQRQGFDPLQDLEGGHRRHAGPEVAQPFAPCAQQKRRSGGLLCENHSVETFVRLCEGREFARRRPVEPTAIHQDPPDHHPMTRQELGRRMQYEMGPLLEGPPQHGRGHGRIDEQRQPVLAGYLAQGRDIEDVDRGVADRLAEKHPGFGPDRATPGIEVARGHEGGRDAEARQGVGEQVVRAPVKAGRGNDVAALAHERHQRQVKRGLAARGGDRPGACLEGGHPLLEHRHGRVRQPRVDVPGHLHIKKGGRGVRVGQDKRRGLVDRDRPGTRCGVRRLPRVDRQGVRMGQFRRFMAAAMVHWNQLGIRCLSCNFRIRIRCCRKPLIFAMVAAALRGF